MRKIVAVALLVGLSACATVEEKGDEISIEHAANQFLAAKLKAEDYCSTRGGKAEHIMTGPRQSSLLALQTSVSVFRCVNASAAKK
tara:strand:+ start:169 stop:426 length:258 start_codon:yes stop_codon:yes gene_type:complete